MKIKNFMIIFWFTIVWWLFALFIFVCVAMTGSLIFGDRSPSSLSDAIALSVFICLLIVSLLGYILILLQLIKYIRNKNATFALLPNEQKEVLKKKDRLNLLWLIPFILLMLSYYGLRVSQEKKNLEFEKSLVTYTNKDYGVSFDYCKDYFIGKERKMTEGNIYHLEMKSKKFDIDQNLIFEIKPKTTGVVDSFQKRYIASNGIHKSSYTIDGYNVDEWGEQKGDQITIYAVAQKDNILVYLEDKSTAHPKCFRQLMNSLKLKI